MESKDKTLDWIRLVISVILGAVLTVVLVVFRIEWWYYTPYTTVRYYAVVLLWLCLSILVWHKIPKSGDEP